MTPVTDRLDVTSDRGGSPEARPRRRGTRVWILAVAAAVAVAVAWFAYSSLYAPLSSGSFSGPRTRAIEALTDGVDRTRLILTGTVGQRGTMVYSLRNNGRFPVRLLGPTDDWTAFGRGLRVGPGVGRGELVGGHADETKPFPVTVRPGEEVSLWVTVTKPRCPTGVFAAIENLGLRWTALGRPHTYRLPLTGDGAIADQALTLCYPAEALKHVDEF